ncbi:hypothetical protein [Solibacillus sp. CAU 1738]|uniref:hypothetical protein n=1 Tax=Solibacillus sp. CAU 1738 TaxID=3140363 RepID=UPI003260716F
MGGITIAVISIVLGASIPIIAILATHNQSKMKLQIKLTEKEIELEKIRLETFEIETEKMRLELDHQKQQLLEMKKSV